MTTYIHLNISKCKGNLFQPLRSTVFHCFARFRPLRRRGSGLGAL